jgi:PLP dependent protein
VRGLMAIPPYSEDPEESRPHFMRLRELAKRIESQRLAGISMKELSMGMSHDFPVAIEEGATLVRIGTAIFGPRSYP